MSRPLVIVESPAKARTIERFLGSDYNVEASVGHVRDLPRSAAEIPAAKKKEKWARLGVDVERGFAPLYIVPAEKKPQIQRLKDLLDDASALYLATDEDREGESISWHLLEVLKPKVPVYRLVFHEITRPAIQAAIDSPRDVDMSLVRAQETRRILDRLYGYEVSPLLWRKVRPRLSAGRVQSVAVRLIVERERERMAFRTGTWWDVGAQFAAGGAQVDAELSQVGDDRIAKGKDFDENTGKLKPNAKVILLDEMRAKGIVESLRGAKATVESVERKPYKDRPAPPFTTSTLQQDMNRKLRWTAQRTMSVAQRLYENGWITYMRTDSLALSSEALSASRTHIDELFGKEYLPKEPRVYKSNVKNAQEAHEAIRPAGSAFKSLGQAKAELDGDSYRLYELIWMRTLASQMEDAQGHNVTMRISAPREAKVISIFVATGKTIEFPGFRRAYVEGMDDPEAEIQNRERLLPPLKEGDVLDVASSEARSHETQPPARLTEATLVKELEARGIGRPSTYASIIETILRREYAFKKGSALVPTFTAMAVTNLLEGHLGWLVDYDFTAKMEEELDDIALGKGDSRVYLEEFYKGHGGLVTRLSEADAAIDPREVCTIPLPADATVNVRVGRFGPYLESGERRADVPEDMPPDELTLLKANALLNEKKEGPRDLGIDPETGKTVYMMKGRFGPYIQLGQFEDVESDPNPTEGLARTPKRRKKKAPAAKPKSASLLKGMEPQTVDLPTALALLSLPRKIGVHPGSGEDVLAANGRFGPYVKSGTDTRSLPEGVSPLTVGLDQALQLLAQPASPRRRKGAEPIREMGADPSNGRVIKIMNGRFGPYVTDGETNASLRRGMDPATLEMGEAIDLIRAREGMPKKPRKGRARAKPAEAKPRKAPAKKRTPTKKAAAAE
jgi:DNA topoisomerase I